MDKYKKYIMLGLIIIGAIFIFSAGRASTSGRFDEYERRVGELGDLLRVEATANRQLIQQLKEADKTITELVRESESAAGASEEITAGLGNLSGELQEDITGLSGVIERLQYYIDQAEKN